MKAKTDEARRAWYRERLREFYCDLKESDDPAIAVMLAEIEKNFYSRFSLPEPDKKETYTPYLLH